MLLSGDLWPQSWPGATISLQMLLITCLNQMCSWISLLCRQGRGIIVRRAPGFTNPMPTLASASVWQLTHSIVTHIDDHCNDHVSTNTWQLPNSHQPQLLLNTEGVELDQTGHFVRRAPGFTNPMPTLAQA